MGTIVYMILRPPEYLEDVRERELEMQAAEARLHQLDYELCPHCDYRVERDFIRCPSCLRKLKERCVSCSKPLDRAWTICPYCETEVAGGRARLARPRRRSASDARDPGWPSDEPSSASRGSGSPLARPSTCQVALARPTASSARAPKSAIGDSESELDEPLSRAAASHEGEPARSEIALEPSSLQLPENPKSTKGHHGPYSDPRKARRLRPLAERRDHRPLRAQGAAHRGAASHDGDSGAGRAHYAEHAERPFFGELVEFITSGPIVAMVLEGVEAVKAARQVIGATNPLEAAPGSIRGDFAIETGQNMVHGSDSPESAAREAALFFPNL